jgi:hypothetical protein
VHGMLNVTSWNHDRAAMGPCKSPSSVSLRPYQVTVSPQPLDAPVPDTGLNRTSSDACSPLARTLNEPPHGDSLTAESDCPTRALYPARPQRTTEHLPVPACGIQTDVCSRWRTPLRTATGKHAAGAGYRWHSYAAIHSSRRRVTARHGYVLSNPTELGIL